MPYRDIGTGLRENYAGNARRGDQNICGVSVSVQILNEN